MNDLDFGDLMSGATEQLTAKSTAQAELAPFDDGDQGAIPVFGDDVEMLQAPAVDTGARLLDLDGVISPGVGSLSIADFASDILSDVRPNNESDDDALETASQFSGSVGCAVLEMPGGISGAGVASRGGEPVFGFKTVDELHDRHPETLWITSAAPTTFSMQQGLRTQWLRDSCYFSTPLINIMQELGLPDQQDPDAIRIAAELMARSVRLTMSMFKGVDFPGDPGETLAENLHSSVTSGARREDASRDVIDALQSTFAPPFTVDAQPKSNDLVLRLPLQRAHHMMTVLAGVVPDGQWREVNLRQIPDPIAWALEPGRPVLALVSVRSMGDAAALLFKRGAPRARSTWLAKPELEVLHSLMDLDIKKMFVADEQIAAVSALRCPPPSLEAVDYGSMSSGLLCEAFLAAACSPAPARKSVGREGEQSASLAHSSRAAWLNSAARAIALQEAVALSDERFNIIGYGAGHVMMSLPKSDLKRLRTYLIRPTRLAHVTVFQ